MTITWAQTIEVGAWSLVIGVAGYVYAWYIARRFDREFPPRGRAPGE